MDTSIEDITTFRDFIDELLDNKSILSLDDLLEELSDELADLYNKYSSKYHKIQEKLKNKNKFFNNFLNNKLELPEYYYLKNIDNTRLTRFQKTSYNY